MSWAHQIVSVFPLFSRKDNQRLRNLSKPLIVNVNQTGLEPVTSRLEVCCSNQLSYKSSNAKKETTGGFLMKVGLLLLTSSDMQSRVVEVVPVTLP